MRGDKSLPDSSMDQTRYNQIVKEEMFSTLSTSGISLVMSKDQCSECAGVKGLVYVLPYNPVTGGHVNIFMKTYDTKGEELFTAFFGHDFGLVTMARLGDTEDIVRRAAKMAAERLTEELQKGSTN